jgi:predicted RNase H-like HicB family nuclease
MKIYNVDCARDESEWWVASIREVPGCHSQGRTIDEARARVREALALFVEDTRSVHLLDGPSV